jgi:hypothetical protein
MQPTPQDEPFRSKEDFMLSLQELEGQFKYLHDALGQIAEALSQEAAVARYAEQQFDTLADVARGGLCLVQAVTSGADITPEWLARRDAFAAQVQKIINGDQPAADNTQGKPAGT